MSKIQRSNDDFNKLANGTNLVVNGDASQGTAGFLAQLDGSSFSVVDGKFNIANPTAEWIYQILPTIIGADYEYTLEANGVNRRVYVGSTLYGLDLASEISTNNNVSLKFTAVSTTTYISFLNLVTSTTLILDNISVKEIPQVQGENLFDYISSRNNEGDIGVVNGDMKVWQRGVSFASANSFSADRWTHRASGGGFTITKDLLGLNDALKIEATISGSTFTSLEQKLEGISKYSGKAITLSFEIESSIAFSKNISFRLYNDATATTISFAYTTLSATIKRVEATVTIPDISGWTITNDYLYIFIDCTLPTIGDTVKFSKIQLDEGSVARPFRQRHYDLERYLCGEPDDADTYGKKPYLDIVDANTVDIATKAPSLNNAGILYAGRFFDFSGTPTIDSVKGSVTPTVTFVSISTTQIVVDITGLGNNFTIGACGTAGSQTINNPTMVTLATASNIRVTVTGSWAIDAGVVLTFVGTL